MQRLGLSLAVVLTTTACGSSPSSPATPSQPPANVAGTWEGTLTTTSVSGGECIGQFWEQIPIQYGLLPFTIAQDGNSITATNLPAVFIGNACPYSGTVTANSFTLNGANCRSYTVGCRDGRGLRDVDFVSATWTGTVAGNAASGQEVETFNVLVSGTNVNVGTLTIRSLFAITRQ